MAERNTPDEKAVQGKSMEDKTVVRQPQKRDLTMGNVTSTMLLFAVPMKIGRAHV